MIFKKPQFSLPLPSLLWLLLWALGVGGLAGCGVTRVTTSERTSVEQALIRMAAKKSLSRLTADAVGEAHHGRSFSIAERYLVNREETAAASDRQYIISLLTAELTKLGLRLAGRSEDAEIVIHPMIDYSGVDDGEFLLGVPSFALPLPGMQASFPEIALLKCHAQYGRVKLSIFGVERESGKLAFEIPGNPRETYYSRWTALIFFGWRATNLEAPF